MIFLILPVVHVLALEFIFSGKVDEMYDDNINTSVNSPKSDWVTNMMVGLAVRSEDRNHVFDLSGRVYQQYCVKYAGRNNNYQDMMLSINKDLSENINFKISDTFQHYPESQSFEVLFGRSEANTGYISNGFSSALSVSFTKQFRFDLVYKNNIINNDSDTMTDSILHNPGGDIAYSFDSANIFRIGYTYSLMKYDDGNESRGNRGYTEYERYFTKQLRTILHGGFDYIDSTAGHSFNSRWKVSIIDDVDAKNQIDISYLKESAISNISNDTLNSWTVRGLLRREISERIAVSLSLFYGQGTYQISREISKLGGASFSLAFSVNNFVNFNMGYNYTRNSSSGPNIDETSYNRNQVYAGISAIY